MSNKSNQIVGAKIVSMSFGGSTAKTTTDIDDRENLSEEVTLTLDSGVTMQFWVETLYDCIHLDAKVKK
jgi:hypothetical protein